MAAPQTPLPIYSPSNQPLSPLPEHSEVDFSSTPVPEVSLSAEPHNVFEVPPTYSTSTDVERGSQPEILSTRTWRENVKSFNWNYFCRIIWRDLTSRSGLVTLTAILVGIVAIVLVVELAIRPEHQKLDQQAGQSVG
jgi:hypothetical protein